MSKKRKLPESPFDQIMVSDEFEISAKHLTQYNQLCGLAKSENLAITYPHLLAFNVLMTLITDKAFPVPIIGLVHTRNVIEQFQPIPAESRLTISCFLEQVSKVKKGLQYRIVTGVKVDNKIYWQSKSDYLYRCKIPENEITVNSQKLKKNNELEWTDNFWEIANNIGRRYAVVSGDYNPIHLCGLSAKLFGFNRAIAHGMWTKAVALGQLNIDSDQIKTVSVEFKQPIYLPAKVNTRFADLAQGKCFKVESGDGESLHLVGEVTVNSARS